MKCFALGIILFSVIAQARLCSMDEIRQIDTRRAGLRYSPYPLMTKVTLMVDVLPLLPRLDSTGGENNNFWLVNFLGFGGWIYFGLQSFSDVSCVDERTGDRFYEPSLAEVARFHHRERDLFWRTYLWSAAWMTGIILTSSFSERQAAAAIALAVPWGFSFSKEWSAFSDDADLQLSFVPIKTNGETVPTALLRWNF